MMAYPLLSISKLVTIVRFFQGIPVVNAVCLS